MVRKNTFTESITKLARLEMSGVFVEELALDGIYEFDLDGKSLIGTNRPAGEYMQAKITILIPALTE